MTSDQASSNGPKLRSFAGAAAPQGLAAGLLGLGQLPEDARQAFWDLLEPNLAPTISPSVEKLVDEYCGRYDVPQDSLVPIVSSCRTLFHHAAGLDLAVELMVEDLKALCGPETQVIRLLTAYYTKALPRIRSFIVIGTLADYGAVLEDVRLRMDYVPTSRHTPQAVTPVALLTFDYREGEERKRLTVQAPATVLQKLKLMCEGVFK